MTTENSEKWTRLPDNKSILRTITALQDRGIKAESVPTREDALKLLTKKIPPGAEVMTGASATLDEIGFLQLLKLGTHNRRISRAKSQVKKTPSDNESFEFGPLRPNTSLEVRTRSHRQGDRRS